MAQMFFFLIAKTTKCQHSYIMWNWCVTFDFIKNNVKIAEDWTLFFIKSGATKSYISFILILISVILVLLKLQM